MSGIKCRKANALLADATKTDTMKKNEGEKAFDELLYTGLTRTRSNLVVINLGNQRVS